MFPPPLLTEPVVVLGASVRYACLSLRRAGLRCEGFDLFGDTETRLAGPTRSFDDYPAGLFAALTEQRPAHWMYTGGMENYVAQFGDAVMHQRLLGTSAKALGPLRDPFRLAEWVEDGPIQVPRLAYALRDNRSGWLAKSARSCGGLGVIDAEASIGRSIASLYFQQHIAGDCLGVVFAAQDGVCRRLGVTRAIDAASTPWSGARQYMYAGSIGPIVLTDEACEAVDSLGARLALVDGLQGVFGVDLIRDANGRLHLIDVNPRLPASAEVIERATGRSIAGLHVACCVAPDSLTTAPASNTLPSAVDGAPLVGKAIVYALASAHVTSELRSLAAADWQAAGDHWLADTPAEDQTIEAGHPIATVFATGGTENEVAQQLKEQATRIRAICS